MNYNQLNTINRALDIYNFPGNNSILHQIQSIRILFENRYIRYHLRYIPSDEALKDRLRHLYFTFFSTNNIHREQLTINEMMDTAIFMKVNLENIPDQAREYERYHRPTPKLLPNNNSLYQISSDKQNVHNSKINENVKIIAINICKKELLQSPKLEIIKDILAAKPSWKNSINKSWEFISKNNSTFGIGYTLSDILRSVFSFIQKREEKEELIDILNDELIEMVDKCSTGCMARMVNVIQGFCEDESLQLRIDNKKGLFTKILMDAPENIQENVTETDQTLVREYLFTNSVILNDFKDIETGQLLEYINDYLKR